MNCLLDTLKLVAGFRRKVIVLGDMLELGIESKKYHRQVGKRVANSNVDFIFTVGPEAWNAGDEAAKTGFPESRIDHFNNSQGASQFLRRFLQPGDLILIKGSRGVKMELITESLRGVRS
jgi:UDP-N-acetylmuramoyl-tripeptide--D-alanyl-D-alanine ligase